MNINGKPYVKIIKEDLFKYLVEACNCDGRYTYRFTCTRGTQVAIFNTLVQKYECWKKHSSYTYTWETKSTMLANMAKEQTHYRSAVVDLKETPDDIFKDYCGIKEPLSFKQEYKCEFNEKGNKMNTNKLKVNYSINISVSGKIITLTDPVKPDEALEAVLTLNTRLNFLKGQFDNLIDAANADNATDNISVNNVTEVLTNEMDEIKEIIDYINDNIDTE